MRFDPITGELIQDEEPVATPTENTENEVLGQTPVGIPQETPVNVALEAPVMPETPVAPNMGFDPMAGQSVPAQGQPGMGFDPMTGQPVPPQGQPGMGFGPMAGQPVPPQGQPGMGFDPMTGQPIPPQGQPGMGFDPVTGQPVPPQGQPTGYPQMPGIKPPVPPKAPKQGGKKGMIIGIAAAAAVVLIAIIVFVSGIFSSPAKKIEKAAKKTFNEKPHFVQDMGALDILTSSKYTVSTTYKGDSYKMTGEFRVNGKEAQFATTVSYDGSPKMDILAGFDDEKAMIEVPNISKNLYEIKYTEENDGAVFDKWNEDRAYSLGLFASYFTQDRDKYAEFKKEITKVFIDELDYLDFSKAEKDDFTINEEDVTCGGYVGYGSGANIVDICDGIEAVFEKYYPDLYASNFRRITNLRNDIEKWREEGEEDNDLYFTFYIYDGMLACIRMENDFDEKTEIRFDGGDYRIQNMTYVTDEKRVQLKGEDNGSEESFRIREKYGRGSDWSEKGRLTYNYGNGYFSVTKNGYSMNGKFSSDKEGVAIKISDYSYDYDYKSVDWTINIKKGAKIEKYSGKSVDLGNADDDELEDIQDAIQEKIYDKDVDGLFNALRRTTKTNLNRLFY